MGKVKQPFQLLAGGYQILFKNGKWSQVFGSKAKQRAFAREDRRGHRSQQRTLGRLRRADPQRIAQLEQTHQPPRSAA
jgi:hypothetical protein